jgi:ribosome-binding factor A
MSTETKRQQKFSRLIKEELSSVFQRDLQHTFTNVFITITGVRMTPDLAVARIYLSFLSTNNQSTADVLDDIKDKNKLIRQNLATRIAKSVRIIPHLEFFLDDTAAYAAKIDSLFAEIYIPPLKEGEKIGDEDLGEEYNND